MELICQRYLIGIGTTKEVEMEKTKIDKYIKLLTNIIEGAVSSGDMPKGKADHCYAVAESAKKIAVKSGMEGDYAYLLGLAHDIGCVKNKGFQHPYTGYKMLISLGFEKEIANVCLTHSFIEGNPNGSCDGLLYQDGEVKNGNYILPFDEGKDEVLKFLATHQYNDYERIVNLCDLMCTNEFVGLTRRLEDLLSRKGVHSTTQAHLSAVYKLKEHIEGNMGCTIEELFGLPNAKQIDITSFGNTYVD